MVEPDAGKEPIAALIRKIIGTLIAECHITMVKDGGVFMRLDAVRTEKHQIRDRSPI